MLKTSLVSAAQATTTERARSTPGSGAFPRPRPTTSPRSLPPPAPLARSLVPAPRKSGTRLIPVTAPVVAPSQEDDFELREWRVRYDEARRAAEEAEWQALRANAERLAEEREWAIAIAKAKQRASEQPVPASRPGSARVVSWP